MVKTSGAEKKEFMIIVFTDIVGSTALTQEIGDDAMLVVKQAHFARLTELLSQFNGREVKNTGDGVLAVFNDAAEAVEFALAAHADPGHYDVTIRAGAYCGMAWVFNNGDIHGNAANFTSRVESACAGAGVMVSDAIKKLIEDGLGRRQTRFRFDTEVIAELKGFDGSHRLWLLAGSPPAIPPEVTPVAPPPPPPQQQAEIPLDEVPEPGYLPAGSRMPWLANADFVGRRDELLSLARGFRPGHATVIGQSAVITGSGGFGKTQLAIEAVWRYGRFFAGGAFWLSFEDGAGIAGEIAACGTLLGLHPDYVHLPPDEQVRLVLQHWHDGRPRLMVLDNCEDESLLRLWLPRIGAHSILVTSRCASWPGDLGLTALKLATLPRHESIRLLRRHRGDLALDDPDLDAIAHELGDLPLALHLAGFYLRRYAGIDAGHPAAYLAVLRHPDLLDNASLTGGTTPTGHDAHVARTFAASTARLDPTDAVDGLALRALVHAACLAPGEAIPRWLLAKVLGMDWADGAVQVALTDALRRLGDLGLMDGAEEGPSLHRLIAAFARTIDHDSAATLATVEMAVGRAAKAQNLTGLPLPLLAWRGHLRWVAERAAERGGNNAGALLSEFGHHLIMIGDYEGAKLAAERALAINEAALGPDHPIVAILLNNLGGVLWKLGDLAGAKPLYERVLRIDEAKYGPDHPEVATDLNNLGTVLRDLGDLAAAKTYLERALKIDEAALGPDHPNVAIRLSNLGGVLRALDDPAAAKPLYQRALRIDEAEYGPDHPMVANRLNNLGSVLLDLGDRDRARAVSERALAIRIQTLGPDHPDTRRTRENLAFLDLLGG